MCSGAVELKYGPIASSAVHLCVDMQKLFDQGGPWCTPWMRRVLPVVERIAREKAANTVFTRFIPPQRIDQMPGMWQRYYAHWHQVTLEHLDPRLLELVEPLAALCPPASLLDKRFYSPFHDTDLYAQLRARGADTVVVTGTETDVCVLAAVLDAVDHGLRVIVVSDAICGGRDETHDALMRVYDQRFSHQIEMATADTVLRMWEPLGA
jgi:nicotinamidase-related amidase